MNYSTGRVFMRSSADFGDMTFTSESMNMLLERSYILMDDSFPGIISILYLNKTPKEALDRFLFPDITKDEIKFDIN